MNWFIIIIVGIVVITLLVFLIIRNQKDEKEFEKKLNRDYPKYKGEESNAITDEPNNDDEI